MKNSQIKAAVAANRDITNDKPSPKQDCFDVVHISIFFDGTGNNKDVDENNHKWSNVARMFFASPFNQSKGQYPIYISGVGTPYNGEAAGWLDRAGVWLQDGIPGMGGGAGGDRRMEFGAISINDQLRKALINNAIKLGGEVANYAKAGSNKSFADLNSALSKHRLIKMINLSIFGFSRGSALARAFSNRIIQCCEQHEDQLMYEGYPLRMNFMGVFDTVASFGVPSTNTDLPWKERDLTVSNHVQRCVHFIAGHEVRFSFPVDLIRKHGQLQAGWLEKTYPGVHSDVGGGYNPNEQSVSDNYARIPMRDMMREASENGVRMMSYETVRQVNFPLFQQRFECKPETEKAYQAYCAAYGAVSGTIEQQMLRHMALLYSAYGTLHRAGKQPVGERLRQEKWIGPRGMAYEVSFYRNAVKTDSAVRFALGNPNSSWTQYVKPLPWQLEAWDRNASKGVLDFVGHYVHDSKVDFIGNIEPFSYFKYRGVSESSKSIWRDGMDWAMYRSKAASDAAQHVYGETKTAVAKGVDTAEKAAQQAYNVTSDAANKAYNVTSQAAQKAYETTSQAATEAYIATTNTAQKVAKAAKDKVYDVQDDVETIYDNGVFWAKTKLNQAAQTAEELAQASKKKIGL